jgi:hypothetical protein
LIAVKQNQRVPARGKSLRRFTPERAGCAGNDDNPALSGV